MHLKDNMKDIRTDRDNSTNTIRHAYLVMAHHRPDLLQELLGALDDERNDIYLHIDKRATSDMNPNCFSVEKSNLFFMDRMCVNWGGYSQIECTLNMLEAATNHDTYERYHLITGASFPLRDQDYIHGFFDKHTEEEFMDIDRPVPERVKYLFLFNEEFRCCGPVKGLIRHALLQLMKCLNMDRSRKFDLTHKKGLAYWSVTHGLASLVVEKKKLIYDLLRYSSCGDEVFMQTIAYNSEFKNNIFDEEGNPHGSLRLSTWNLEDAGIERPNHSFIKEDRALILNEKTKLFAFKFEGPDGLKLIEDIKKYNFNK